jgi:branched-chain amino acid transport system permease protein
MEYLLHLLIMIGIYTILALSLNLIAGYTGLVSVAHAAFYGIGAYVTALLALHVHSPFLINLLVAMMLAGGLGALVAIPSLRIHDDYFVIATFAFQIVILSVMNNWISVTRAPWGCQAFRYRWFLGL